MSIKEKPTEKKKVNDQGTFTKFPNILFDECDLPETAQIIFMRLCRHVCHKNNVFVGSIRKLSNLVRISKSTVERMLPRLEEAHYIKKEWDEERKQMIIHVLMAPLWEQNKSRTEPTPDLGPHNSIIVPNWDTREINYLNYDAFVPEWDDLMEAVNNPVPKRDKFVPKWDRSGSNWDKSVPPSSSNVGTTTITTITTGTTRENAHVSNDTHATLSSSSNSPSSLQETIEESTPAPSDEQSSKQESAVSDSQSKDVPPAQDTKQPELIERPKKPVMPPESMKWNAEKLVQITEALRGRYYTEKQRQGELKAAKKILDEEILEEQYVQAFCDRNDQWWRERNGLLNVTDMAAIPKDKSVMRVVSIWQKLEAREERAAQKQQPTNTKQMVETVANIAGYTQKTIDLALSQQEAPAMRHLGPRRNRRGA